MAESLHSGIHDALIVIDVQRDFCPGGALAVAGGDQVVPVINALMDAFSTVVVTQDWHPRGHRSFASAHPGRKPFDSIDMPYGPQVLWPDHCVQDTAGAAFHPDLRTAPGQLVLRKGMNPDIDSYSAFLENDQTTATGLAGYLRDKGIRRVFCCGLATDFCVYFTVKDARRMGFETVLVEDACRGINIDGKSVGAARSDMAACGTRVVDSHALYRGHG